MSKDDIKPTKKIKKHEKKTNIKELVDTLLSYVALAGLAAFAYIGVKSLVDAEPVFQTSLGIILVALLTKTALKK